MKKIAMIAAMLILSSCSMHSAVQVTSNTVGKKVGEACASYLFGNFHIEGSNFAHIAAQKGKIKKVASMNRYTSGLFPIYYKSCTVVSGR